VAACGLLFAGCTTDGGGPANTVAASDLGFLTPKQYEEISAELAAASAIPEEEVPTEAVDIATLKGKKVLIMPSASFLTDCDTISKQMVTQLQELGMSGTYFQTDGTTGSWVAGMQQAISQGYNGIVLLCGLDPDLISAQVKEATSAGIIVGAGALYDTSLDGGRISDLIQAQTNSPLYASYRATALQAIMDNRTEPFDALMLTADEVAATPALVAGADDAFAKYCPDCTITKVNVPMAEVATKAGPAVQSALVANPDIKVVLPLYGSTGTTYAAAALLALNRPDVGVYGAYGMPVADIKQMGTAGSNLAGVTRHNNTLRMMTVLDQTMRAMAGQQTVDPNVYVDPNRLVTPTNVKEFLAVGNEGFGDAVVDRYRELWGLK
jgi:ribose transport system substrate-binding protein